MVLRSYELKISFTKPPTDDKGLSLDPELEPNVNPPDPELVLELEPELVLELDPEPNNPNNPPEPEPNINPPLGRFVVVGAAFSKQNKTVNKNKHMHIRT